MTKVKLIFSCHSCTRDCVKIYEFFETDSDINLLFYVGVYVAHHSYCMTQGVKGISLPYPAVKL